MLWLGSKEVICNLWISDDPIYALSVHFTYNIELSHKKNYFEKLGSLKKTFGPEGTKQSTVE